MATPADRIAPRAIVVLDCGCVAQDAGWLGRLQIVGPELCAEAAGLVADLRAAARGESALGIQPADSDKAAALAFRQAAAAAQAALFAHVEDNRPSRPLTA